MKVEFIKETKVNKTTVKKGTKMDFTDVVGQSFVDSGNAKKVKGK